MLLILNNQLSGLQEEKNILLRSQAPRPTEESSKLDEIMDMLRAKQEQKYTFSASTAGRDMAVVSRC
ncbi:hypothetical protein ABBQ32_004302 [Trebouxia sp. C0010 RCD-2024]